MCYLPVPLEKQTMLAKAEWFTQDIHSTIGTGHTCAVHTSNLTCTSTQTAAALYQLHTAALKTFHLSARFCMAQVAPVMETSCRTTWDACTSYQRTSPLMICRLQLFKISFLSQSSVDWYSSLCTVLCFLNIAQTSFPSKLRYT